uniref:Uncharacterized protein n=1 Tax=Physcomitrium patens TaxID=3218 RepID=A0A2K1K474_PHYPA|nr:hypothetical protein PHYPA_013054 [Physcomitrium patens]
MQMPFGWTLNLQEKAAEWSDWGELEDPDEVPFVKKPSVAASWGKEPEKLVENVYSHDPNNNNSAGRKLHCHLNQPKMCSLNIVVNLQQGSLGTERRSVAPDASSGIGSSWGFAWSDNEEPLGVANQRGSIRFSGSSSSVVPEDDSFDMDSPRACVGRGLSHYSLPTDWI